MFNISFKVHQKNDNKWFSAAQLKRVNKSMNRSMTFMFCVLLGHFTRCCANLFQDFPFSLASICTLSFISKLNARSILKVKGCVAKSDAILVAINKRINTNSNEASWSSQLVLQQSSNKSLSFRDGPTGGTLFVNIYQNVRLDP